MTTNTQIRNALYQMLASANLGEPIAWPGVPFDPPTGDGALWVEVQSFPNQGIDDGLSHAASVAPQGIFQVSAFARQGGGEIAVSTLADQIAAAFPRGSIIAGAVKVSRHPYQLDPIHSTDRIEIPVTITYSG